MFRKTSSYSSLCQLHYLLLTLSLHSQKVSTVTNKGLFSDLITLAPPLLLTHSCPLGTKFKALSFPVAETSAHGLPPDYLLFLKTPWSTVLQTRHCHSTLSPGKPSRLSASALWPVKVSTHPPVFRGYFQRDVQKRIDFSTLLNFSPPCKIIALSYLTFCFCPFDSSLLCILLLPDSLSDHTMYLPARSHTIPPSWNAGTFHSHIFLEISSNFTTSLKACLDIKIHSELFIINSGHPNLVPTFGNETSAILSCDSYTVAFNCY